MKRLLAIALLLATGGVASAEIVPYSNPPAGWKQDWQQGVALAKKSNDVAHFGGLPSMTTGYLYVAPEGGAAFIVTEISGNVGPADRDAAARFALDELFDATSRAGLAGGGITVDSSSSRVITDQKLVRGDLQYTDKSSGTQTTAQIEIVASDGAVIAVTGECVIGSAPPDVAAACRAALATIKPPIDLSVRAPIGLAAPGTALTSAVPTPTPSQLNQSTISDGSHTPLPPMQGVPTEKPATDRRPVYVGLGIVLLAAAFWWNQRRRAKFEKDSDDE